MAGATFQALMAPGVTRPPTIDWTVVGGGGGGGNNGGGGGGAGREVRPPGMGLGEVGVDDRGGGAEGFQARAFAALYLEQLQESGVLVGGGQELQPAAVVGQ